jgi:CCR4-NOT transcription complex subunit 1
MEPHIRLNDMAEPVTTLYKGILRVLLVLLHDFPDFLSENHVHLLQAIPSQAIQIRNLICSAMPRVIRPPDPFTPNLQVDMLPDVRRPPVMKTDVNQILSSVIRGNSNLRVDLEAWIQTGGTTFLDSLPNSLLDNPASRGEFRFNNSVLNALVIFMANADLATWPSRQSLPSESSILSRKSIELFASLSVNLDSEGRFQLFSALANQLRFPNAHTHHACTILLFLFREMQPNVDAQGHIQEQITRVLMERLILLKPHPWGVLITFIELIRNPQYNFWAYEFVRAPSDIYSIFQSVARNCLNPQQVENKNQMLFLSSFFIRPQLFLATEWTSSKLPNDFPFSGITFQRFNSKIFTIHSGQAFKHCSLLLSKFVFVPSLSSPLADTGKIVDNLSRSQRLLQTKKLLY